MNAAPFGNPPTDSVRCRCPTIGVASAGFGGCYLLGWVGGPGGLFPSEEGQLLDGGFEVFFDWILRFQNGLTEFIVFDLHLAQGIPRRRSSRGPSLVFFKLSQCLISSGFHALRTPRKTPGDEFWMLHAGTIAETSAHDELEPSTPERRQAARTDRILPCGGANPLDSPIGDRRIPPTSESP